MSIHSFITEWIQQQYIGCNYIGQDVTVWVDNNRWGKQPSLGSSIHAIWI